MFIGYLRYGVGVYGNFSCVHAFSALGSAGQLGYSYSRVDIYDTVESLCELRGRGYGSHRFGRHDLERTGFHVSTVSYINDHWYLTLPLLILLFLQL